MTSTAGNGALTRRRLVGMAATAGGAYLAACGALEPALGSAGEAGRAPSIKALDLTVMAYGDTEVQERYDTVAAVFNERYAGRLKYTPTIVPFAQYIDKAVTTMAADTAPDVLNMWAQYKPDWVGKSLVLDLTDRIKASKAAAPSQFLQPMVDAMTYRGRIWGTAQDFNGQMIFVNLDLLAARNLPVPQDTWTMDQYRDLARKLIDQEKQVFGSTNLINAAGWSNFAFLWNFGKQYWISADGTRSVVASPASIQAHQFYADMQFRDRTIPWRDNPLAQGTNQGTGHLAFSLVWGNYPFALYDGWAKSGRQPFKWKMLPFPKGPQDQKDFSHGHLWSIPRSNKRPDAAWLLAEWIGGLDGWQEWAKTHRQPLPVKSPDLWKTYFGFLPADKATEMTTFLVDRLYKGLAFNFEYWPTYGECSKVMGEGLKAIFVENANVKTTLEETQRRMEAVLTASSAR